MKSKMTGHETLIVLSDDPRLQDIGSFIADEIGSDPPVLTDRGGLRTAIDLIRSEGRDPLILLYSTDMEEFGYDLGLEVIERSQDLDSENVFLKPTLSFMSRYGPFWDSIPERPRAVYEERYSNLANGYLDGLRRGGLYISAMSVTGDISSYFRNGSADIGIGMLRNEDLLINSGSWPLDRISMGDPVIARIPS